MSSWLHHGPFWRRNTLRENYSHGGMARSVRRWTAAFRHSRLWTQPRSMTADYIERDRNSNQLSWLSGIPSTVRTLSVASNLYVSVACCPLGPLLNDRLHHSWRIRLTGVTSFSHLLNLENLDISRNKVDSLRRKFPKDPTFGDRLKVS